MDTHWSLNICAVGLWSTNSNDLCRKNMTYNDTACDVTSLLNHQVLPFVSTGIVYESNNEYKISLVYEIKPHQYEHKHSATGY